MIGAAGIAATVAMITTPAGATSAGPSAVKAFNDGYAAAKQDDCQQGFSTACAWLGRNGYRPVLPAWFHAQRASRGMSRDGCGRWPNGKIVYGVQVWGGNGDTGALVCRNGTAFTS